MTKNNKKGSPQKSKTIEKDIKVVSSDKKTSYGDPIWALFLISIGSLFLLNNFGVLPWSIWTSLWRFWPIFLMLAGIRIIIGKSLISNILVTILGILIFGLIIIYSTFIASTSFRGWLENRSPYIHQRFENFIDLSESRSETKKITVEGSKYSEVNTRTINLELGARTVTVQDDNEDYYLFMDTNFLSGRNAPSVEESFENNNLTLSVDTKKESFGWNTLKDPYMEINLGKPEISTSLDLALGAGTANVELDQVNIEDIELNIGAGTLNLNLKDNSLSNIDIFVVEVGAGTMNLELPNDVNIGWKMTYDIGLGTLNIDGDDYHSDGIFTSDNYDEAENQIEISIDSGVGTVNIDTK